MQHHRQAMIKISVHVVDLDLEDPELKIRDQGKVLKLIREKSRDVWMYMLIGVICILFSDGDIS